jgi:putative SOS response-associated peptidase YedK
MCGRYTLTVDLKKVADTFHVMPAPSFSATPRYNIAPTQDVVAIVREGVEADAQLVLLRWGLIPGWAKDETIGAKMINARAETLAEKASFKRLLRSRRCLVIADGFYEWKKESRGGKMPMYITLKNHAPFAFAGLWDEWRHPDGPALRTCTIITTEPNAVVSPIHNRMPAILSPDARATWLDMRVRDEHALLALLGPYPATEMTARPVSRLVNDPKYDSAELIA